MDAPRRTGSSRGRLRIGAAILGCCVAMPLMAAPPLEVTYPPSESQIDDRSDYPRALLDLALRESGIAYSLRQATTRLPQARALNMLADGKGIDVYWSMTNRQREADLLPIRIPIDRGLLGWRLLLIRANDQARFSAITSIEQLKMLSLGQGHDWPDTEILAEDGFPMTAVPGYDLLFPMLQKGRIDCLPRSIGEIRDEAAIHANDGLVIETSLALHYPAAEYFFVNRDNHVLAQALQRGLAAAINDGSFSKLFSLYFAEQIRTANLDRRRIFELPNPELPAETPLHDTAYWFKPAAGSR